MSFSELTISFDGSANIVTGTLYVILFTCVCTYLSFKFFSREINISYIMLILLFLAKTICFSVYGIMSIYGKKNCELFYLTRLAYFCTFLLITYTYYHWCNSFCENEIKIVEMKVVKWTILLMNIIVFVAITSAFFYYLAQGSYCSDSNTFAVKLNTWMITSSNLLVAFFCVTFTIYLIYAYRKTVHHLLSLQSKRSFSIVIICSFILVFEMTMRVVFHLYKPITNHYMNDILFRSGTYYIPDIIEYTIILIMWNLDVISASITKHDEKELLKRSEIIIRNITIRYYDKTDISHRDLFEKFMQPESGSNKTDESDDAPITDETYRNSCVLSNVKNPLLMNDDNPDIL
ncbi:hypothetical protein EDI_026780 [Entamoeba dispar SAW760]|uniref:THH1/TOM1/TOM3 domain-containing protein n=1 Tax=Entamoeba dispar (strain ATCC PRA-260 / SAW760) TaxID=370354 RepID=B0EPX7_ENTDS|nr:uncharacterized protein EDI_026780 [Entamoeba dispar SAW760]EDR23446.1 hypothetical protein EDI_026780 [Entamoeba dispar SAW760]|eukprot:EDR23446.1 hypothetical protein EDI_026780 [Entamoeba dispar SAW760]